MHAKNLFVALAACGLILSSAPFAQGPAPVCDLVSEADAAAVIGTIKQKQSILGADHCTFTAEGLSLSISRMGNQDPETVKMMLELPKNRARPGDVVQSEPGIGQGATSETSKGRIALIAASGHTVWTFGVDHVYRKEMADTLPKLRELAKKLVRP
jgi:hypothetical protein